jgi:hypothetical protein
MGESDNPYEAPQEREGVPRDGAPRKRGALLLEAFLILLAGIAFAYLLVCVAGWFLARNLP